MNLRTANHSQIGSVVGLKLEGGLGASKIPFGYYSGWLLTSSWNSVHSKRCSSDAPAQT